MMALNQNLAHIMNLSSLTFLRINIVLIGHVICHQRQSSLTKGLVSSVAQASTEFDWRRTKFKEQSEIL